MEDLWVFDQRCIDIYNNDIYQGDDDAIESDFTQRHARIMRNRITNCFIGLSSQPGLAGRPIFIRNVIYNLINTPFKLARGSTGDWSCTTRWSRWVTFLGGAQPINGPVRNNLTVGGHGGSSNYGGYGTARSGGSLCPRE